MKWVLIRKRHINTDQVQAFWWADGKLRIMFENDEALHIIEDPEKQSYRKMCQAIGVRPNEEDTDQ